ncbi:MAG TPA: hypothetical protein VKR53_09655 [Puia sp.]|nr:hypothetical protein [Puia sp.]
MDEEKILTEKESLALITSMINKAKCDYEETGISALLWGIIITFCSLISFSNNYWWDLSWVNYVWFLTLLAIVPQIIISIRESKRKKYKSYHDDAMGGIWISFGVGIMLLSFYTGVFHTNNDVTLYLILYGIPTFATGFARKFAPMIIGGIASWIFAVISMYIPFPFALLLSAATAQLAWFIPGLILRRRYLKLKNDNV